LLRVEQYQKDPLPHKNLHEINVNSSGFEKIASLER
jgi:hypothetical protein